MDDLINFDSAEEYFLSFAHHLVYENGLDETSAYGKAVLASLQYLIFDKWNKFHVLKTVDAYHLTSEEFDSIHSMAIEKINEGIMSLIDKGLAETVINENGDMAYRLTEEGKQVALKNK